MRVVSQTVLSTLRSSMWKTAAQRLRTIRPPPRPTSARSSSGRPPASACLGQLADVFWLAGVPALFFTQAFIDAAHDYANVHQDVLAYWSKVKPNGVLAGHDFNHHRNWAGILEKRLEYSKSAAGERPVENKRPPCCW